MENKKIIQIKIIRHSERLDFSNPLYWLFYFGYHWADSPITTNGHELAYSKGKEIFLSGFSPAYIYTSPYNRTIATSTEFKKSFPSSEVIIEPLLSEYQPYHSHKITYYPNGIPTSYNGEETSFEYPESYEKFEERIVFIISRLLEKSDGNFIVVTHGEVIKAYTNYIQKLYPDLLFDYNNISYLKTLSFNYDKNDNRIQEESVVLV